MTSVPNQKGMDFALGQMEFALGDGIRSRQITLVRTFFLTHGIAYTAFTLLYSRQAALDTYMYSGLPASVPFLYLGLPALGTLLYLGMPAIGTFCT